MLKRYKASPFCYNENTTRVGDKGKQRAVKPISHVPIVRLKLFDDSQTDCDKIVSRFSFRKVLRKAPVGL